MKRIPLTPAELNELTAGLHRLAHNLWWSWDQDAQDVFHDLSPRGWQNLYHTAVAVLHEVSDYELRVRLQEPGFAERVRKALRQFAAYNSVLRLSQTLRESGLSASELNRSTRDELEGRQ